jgi:hypothetical protein
MEDSYDMLGISETCTSSADEASMSTLLLGLTISIPNYRADYPSLNDYNLSSESSPNRP